ncbi:hypothetical protein [Cryptosporangium phraense]|uniref:Uncharacterized protein n=1 Tax=Cryptosporangium phraense TaxID=2593070 RepID=A0A545ALM7_9ACTN|nr:hypothetical protein [Cryptosporangium phraense]TQS42212.1 hypothetical protein FL583_25060 [Cryptosporangium phraense]
MTSDQLFATAAVSDAQVVRDRRRRGQHVELIGTISAVDVNEGTATIVDVQDGRRVHAELVVQLTDGATITVDGRRRVLSALPIGQKLLVAGLLDGTLLLSGEVHALTIAG